MAVRALGRERLSGLVEDALCRGVVTAQSCDLAKLTVKVRAPALGAGRLDEAAHLVVDWSVAVQLSERRCNKSINRFAVLLSPVIPDLFRAQFCRTVVKRRPVTFKGKEWNGEPAGSLHRTDSYQNDLTCAWKRFEFSIEVIPSGIRARDGLTCSVESQDEGLLIETTEHESNAAVIAQVRRGFVAAAGQVQVGDRVLVENPKAVEAFGGDIHAAAGTGCGGDKKHLLLNNEIPRLLGNAVEKTRHGTSLGQDIGIRSINALYLAIEIENATLQGEFVLPIITVLSNELTYKAGHREGSPV